MTACERVLSIAAGEVGVKESPANSNRVKYNTWFYGKEVSGASYPWCCSFVVNIFDMAGCATLVRRTAGCTTLLNWFKAKGWVLDDVKDAKPGDIPFYQFDTDAYADHVGIIESVSKTGIVAIEGNTSATSNDNGGAVMRRNRKWSCIMAVARPDYESIDKANAKEENNMPNEKETRTAYNKVAELPEWAQEPVRRLIAAGIIEGDGKNEINLTDNDLVCVSMADKQMTKLTDMVDSLRAEMDNLRENLARNEG